MKKALLLSINPKWVEKILNGEKTIEIRKSKIEIGTEVFIYETKNGGGSGKVVGKFIVDSCVKIIYPIHSPQNNTISNQSRLDRKDMLEYCKDETIKTFAIGISQVKVFDKPMELREFYKKENFNDYFNTTRDGEIIKGVVLSRYKELNKAPQSKQWVYYEEE